MGGVRVGTLGAALGGRVGARARVQLMGRRLVKEEPNLEEDGEAFGGGVVGWWGRGCSSMLELQDPVENPAVVDMGTWRPGEVGLSLLPPE